MNPEQPLDDEFLTRIQASLDAFFTTQQDLLALTGNHLDPIWEQAKHFASGGKRIRPAFCFWGYIAAAGMKDVSDAIVDIAASLDLLHLSALIHDDIIDASETRRGSLAAHRYYENYHRDKGWHGIAEQFGVNTAILLGDLLLAWSVSMVERAAVSPERMSRTRPYLDAMRSEVLAGQVLDLFSQSKPLDLRDLLADVRLVMEYKTAKYTVSRPVQIGAALGLASEATLQGLSQFGAHVGNAFQMRDDLLGIFGDPLVTGKPSGEDLKQGKKTVVIGYALHQAIGDDQAFLAQMLGNRHLSEEDVAQARQIIIGCGAAEATEKAILTQAAAAMKVLHRLDLTSEGVQALMGLVHAAVERKS